MLNEQIPETIGKAMRLLEERRKKRLSPTWDDVELSDRALEIMTLQTEEGYRATLKRALQLGTPESFYTKDVHEGFVVHKIKSHAQFSAEYTNKYGDTVKEGETNA